jgi:2-polyprenyl-6-methoxyphenol hydroxylase-like FAD-dependent oxidoreductase
VSPSTITLIHFLTTPRSSGVAPRVISRHNLTKVLYERLSKDSQKKILTSKRVEKIASLKDGVRVTCTDGTSYEASSVLGADGAHSRVRAEMRSLALEHNSAGINAEQPYLTTFRCLWLRIPTTESLTIGLTCETHGHGATSQFFVGTDSAVLGLYEPLDEPTRERRRYTPADEQELVRRWASMPLVPGGELTLGEAYESKTESGMVSLEEGVVEHWSWNGRIVLAGDAAHKFTPSTGEGCNSGIVDVLTLMDEMASVFRETRTASGNPNAVPEQAEIIKAAQKYQAIRFDAAQKGCEASGRATTTALWSTPVHKFLDCYVLSHRIVQRFMAGKNIKKSVAPQTFGFLQRRQAAVASA